MTFCLEESLLHKGYDPEDIGQRFLRWYRKTSLSPHPRRRNPGAAINRIKEMSDFEVARLMLTMPFEKFERKFFLEHRKDLNRVAFVPSLWRRLGANDREELTEICREQINRYFGKRK